MALLVLVLVACRPAPALTPFAAAAPTTQLVHLRAATPTQAATPLVDATPLLAVSAMPAEMMLPTQTPKPLSASVVVTAEATTEAPTKAPTEAVATAGSVPTWTPLPTWTPPPNGGGVPAHFLLEWPIANSGGRSTSRVYPYGGSYNGRLQVHHGIDLVNPLGTPLFAAGDGTVLYAGDDFSVRFGPDNNYYGYLVVIQHNFMSPEREPVFTLYGHLLHVGVQAGQAVQQGDVIGTVGQSGVARGPHLHFEVRIGYPFDFGATRNPELWLRPFPNNGVLAGRVSDEHGTPLYGVTIQVQVDGLIRSAYSYADGTVNSDPLLGENFTLGDLPPGYYVVSVTQDGQQQFAQPVYVEAEQVTWVEIAVMRR